MNFDTPLVEYLIIGMQTTSWITIIIFKAFKIPLNTLLKVDVTAVLLLLPFVYILGMMVDDIVFSVFKNETEKIKEEVLYGIKRERETGSPKRNILNKILGYFGLVKKDRREKLKNKKGELNDKKKDPKFMDENIALKSPDLYSAYEARVRRIKIIAAAFFNWPLLGLSLCIYFGNQNKFAYIYHFSVVDYFDGDEL